MRKYTCERILILCESIHNEIEFDQSVPVDCTYAYRNNSILIRVIRNSRYFIRFALSEKLMRVDQYTHIIIFDYMYKPGLIWEIRKKNKYARIIFYFRNTIQSLKQVNWIFPDKEIKENNVELWSYSKKDCERYNYRYNAQFINNHLLKRNSNKGCKYDLVFVGREKGRSQIIENIYEECEKKKLTSYFYISDGGLQKYNQNRNNRNMPYNKYIQEYSSQSRALLDIVTSENYGLTLRPLEALYLKKKLFTNYQDIRNENFYNESNIFIFNNSFEDIIDFFNTPIQDIPEEIKEIYSCEHWLENFLL